MNNNRLICKHFGRCGGCASLETAYPEQLNAKAEQLTHLYQNFWSKPVAVTPSPVLYHYRNKIDPGYALKRYPEPPPKDFERETVLGFKERGRWFWPIEIQECLIAPEGTGALLAALGDWREKSGLTAYDSRKETGYLRNLLLRDGKRTGEYMVVLITSPGALSNAEAFVEAVKTCFSTASIYHGEFSGKAEVATADKLTLLDGPAYITETLHLGKEQDAGTNLVTALNPSEFIKRDKRDYQSLHFRISPLSFFQTNPLGAERLYGMIRDWVEHVSPDCLLDLYGGAGGIAFSCAAQVPEVVSVESVKEATEDGRVNASRNNIHNVVFVNASVKNYLHGRIEGGGLASRCAVVLDPPRSGMHPKAIARIMELAPQHILYVSCNPKILRRELDTFGEAYYVTDMQAVDMFPHTPHVEVLAALERKG